MYLEESIRVILRVLSTVFVKLPTDTLPYDGDLCGTRTDLIGRKEIMSGVNIFV